MTLIVGNSGRSAAERFGNSITALVSRIPTAVTAEGTYEVEGVKVSHSDSSQGLYQEPGRCHDVKIRHQFAERFSSFLVRQQHSIEVAGRALGVRPGSHLG